MNCPKCKTSVLKTKYFNSPFYCNTCGGMWLEFDNLPKFVQDSNDLEIFTSASSQHDSQTGICPQGHGIMTRAKIEIDDPFYLEKCVTCGGVWFDQGEWQKLVKNNLIENINDFWCRSWQRQQRQVKERQNYLDLNKKILGDVAFEKIMELSEILKIHPEKGRAIALLQQEIL